MRDRGMKQPVPATLLDFQKQFPTDAACERYLFRWPNDGSVDMYYWYYGTEAMFQMGDPYWKVWNTALKKALLRNQRKDTAYGIYKGSWDPIGPWGPDGGRVYSTAICALCLETYYRYERVVRESRARLR